MRKLRGLRRVGWLDINGDGEDAATRPTFVMVCTCGCEMKHRLLTGSTCFPEDWAVTAGDGVEWLVPAEYTVVQCRMLLF